MCCWEPESNLGTEATELRTLFFVWMRSHFVLQRKTQQTKAETTCHKDYQQEAHHCKILVPHTLPRNYAHSEVGMSRCLTRLPPTNLLPPSWPQVFNTLYGFPKRSQTPNWKQKHTLSKNKGILLASQVWLSRCVCGVEEKRKEVGRKHVGMQEEMKVRGNPSQTHREGLWNGRCAPLKPPASKDLDLRPEKDPLICTLTLEHPRINKSLYFRAQTAEKLYIFKTHNQLVNSSKVCIANKNVHFSGIWCRNQPD